MRFLFFCIAMLACTASVFGQDITRYQIQGTIVDSASAPLPSASIMLLQRKDSSLVNFSYTNDKGLFTLRNVKKGDYLIKVSYVSYMPLDYDVVFGNDAVLQLGNLKLKPIVKSLFEVVIKAARAPLTIKGDTVEYNAASFKVPPGSTVEDLLRKLPGVDVDREGNIKAQGQDVKKVLIDGKSFFGNDPKVATKNLDAMAVKKVQVFDDKTEQAKLTGVDDGKKEKTVNLELKDEFKKGGFGKIAAGVGSSQRGQLKGNYNKFDKTQQYSVIGLSNNTNETGMSWDDYQDFRGSGSFSGWNDETDFGFSSGNRWFSFSDDEGEGGIDIPVGGGTNRGFSNNIAGGANYNYDTKKDKLSANYYYNSTRQMIDATKFEQRFLTNNSSTTADEESSQINFYANHRASLRYQKTIDTLNTVLFFSNGRFGQSNAVFGNTQSSMLDKVLTNTSTRNNNNTGQRLDINNAAMYNHKFSKKGRNFAWSVGYNLKRNDGQDNQESVNQFFKAMSLNDQLGLIRQLSITNSTSDEYKSSIRYIEPISKKFYWETFYNFSLANRSIDRDVNDKIRAKEPRIDSLSRYFTNKITFNRLGTGLRYSFKGTNFMVGMARQRFDLEGIFANDQTSTKTTVVSKTYSSWLPAFSLNIDLKKNRYMGVDYSASAQQPAIKDLQPVVDNSNPLYVQEGNPNLVPTVRHNVWVNFSIFDPATFINFFSYGGITYNIDQIVYNQIIDPQTLITRTTPMNISGGNNANMGISFGFPIVKTKATVNLNMNGWAAKNITYINNIENNTHNRNISLSSRLNLTPKDWFTAYLGANIQIGNTKYSINTAQNQKILQHGFSADVNFKLPKNIFLNSSFNTSTYKNDRFGFNQTIPIWNASVYSVLGKDKKTEIRLSAYDLLNQNRGISQSAFGNYVTQSVTQTLARYFMLTFTYNMRGVDTNIKKDRNSW